MVAVVLIVEVDFNIGTCKLCVIRWLLRLLTVLVGVRKLHVVVRILWLWLSLLLELLPTLLL